MNPKNLFCRHVFKDFSKFNRRISFLQQPCNYYILNDTCTTSSSPTSSSIHSAPAKFRGFLQPNSYSTRLIHTVQETNSGDDSQEESEEDEAMNEFLSRFVWIMRGKLTVAFPESDKKTIDAMLLIIVAKVVSEMEKGGLEQMNETAAATPSEDFSGDLWRTVWEVSNVVLDDMQKAQKKEKMKNFLQSEEVKEMSRFAGEIGIRGDMLRELRFKWAREKMEESEFYEGLERLRQEAAEEDMKSETNSTGPEQIYNPCNVDGRGDEEKPNVVSLPKRHGKLKYKIYGLDLSDPKWAEVANKIHETGKIIWPQESKPITGKCKIVTEKILSLQLDDDPSKLLAEWVELLQPSRSDWIALLDRLKERNTSLYFKVCLHFSPSTI